mmetsp:Transcript_41580/g.115706  ORF Transcript_41580/g.115706 Transcript_41580/m.115706 type:complete len:355 (+) Transcript_41580:302-1366(+)
MVGDTQRVLPQLGCLVMIGVCERAAASCRLTGSLGLGLSRTAGPALMKREGPCGAGAATACVATAWGSPSVATELHRCRRPRLARLATELDEPWRAAGAAAGPGAGSGAGQTHCTAGPLLRRSGGEGERWWRWTTCCGALLGSAAALWTATEWSGAVLSAAVSTRTWGGGAAAGAGAASSTCVSTSFAPGRTFLQAVSRPWPPTFALPCPLAHSAAAAANRSRSSCHGPHASLGPPGRTAAAGGAERRSSRPRWIRTASAARRSASSCGLLASPRSLTSSVRVRTRLLSSTATSSSSSRCLGSGCRAASSSHSVKDLTRLRSQTIGIASAGKPPSESSLLRDCVSSAEPPSSKL